MKTTGHTIQRLFALLTILSILLLSGCASLVTEGAEKSRIVSGSQETEGLIYAGEVTAELRSWNWLFKSSPEERRERLEQQALLQAREQFGGEARIKVELISGRMNPLSLLMLFGLAGFVEDTLLEASVWLPAPEPEPEEEPVPRYRVIPEADYSSPKEFTTVTYKDRSMLEEELRETHAREGFSSKELERRLSDLPAAGMLQITYGRSEITNAISRWFTFTLTHEDAQIFKKRGVEDVPFVYGTDNLWWNELSYKIDEEWDKELQLIIEDNYQEKTYRFRIIKEEM